MVWSGKDGDRQLLDLLLRPADLLMLFTASIMWVLNVPTYIHIDDLPALQHAFVIFFGGLDAVTALGMLQQKKKSPT